jgi:hypothetical protein
MSGSGLIEVELVHRRPALRDGTSQVQPNQAILEKKIFFPLDKDRAGLSKAPLMPTIHIN